jgi:hypothetical protein
VKIKREQSGARARAQHAIPEFIRLAARNISRPLVAPYDFTIEAEREDQMRT